MNSSIWLDFKIKHTTFSWLVNLPPSYLRQKQGFNKALLREPMVFISPDHIISREVLVDKPSHLIVKQQTTKVMSSTSNPLAATSVATKVFVAPLVKSSRPHPWKKGTNKTPKRGKWRATNINMCFLLEKEPHLYEETFNSEIPSGSSHWIGSDQSSLVRERTYPISYISCWCCNRPNTRKQV